MTFMYFFFLKKIIKKKSEKKKSIKIKKEKRRKSRQTRHSVNRQGRIQKCRDNLISYWNPRILGIF